MFALAVTGNIAVLGYGLAAIGSAIGVGMMFSAVINGTARQPEARETLQSIAWIGFGVVEVLAVIGIALAFVFRV
jgi:F-type H+-transporting ATPase subunit c